MKSRSVYEVLPATRAERNAWSLNKILKPENIVTMTGTVDASQIVAMRDRYRAQFGEAPSFTAIVMKAAGLMMERHPAANRAIIGPPLFRRLIQFNSSDISVAIETNLPCLPGLAFTAPIRGTAAKDLRSISRELRAFTEVSEATSADYASYMKVLKRVPWPLSGWLIHLPHWIPTLWMRYRGCACWVNAPSRAGVDSVAAAFPWPLTFTFGVIKERPFVVDGRVEARQTMPVGMLFDRRIMGGGPASRLFVDFMKCLAVAEFSDAG